MSKTQNLKYNKAWDNKLKKYVSPSEVSEVERHDKNRYFSEKFDIDEDKGEVLTLHKQSKTYKTKKGTDVKRQAHFSGIGKNTRDYRERTSKLITKQESLVHKLCKEVVKDIKHIRVPEVKVNIMGINYTILYEQLIKTELKSIETKDKDSGRIPDVTLEVEIFGTKQELYLEFLYAHGVDESKRKRLEYFKKNCLEVDLSILRDNLEESEKSLRSKIKKIIEKECYWVTNSVKLYCEKEALEEYILEISKKNGLLNDSNYYNLDRVGGDYDKYLYMRMFLFKDNLRVNENHPCYFVEDPNIQYNMNEKCTNIGDCNKCSNCIWIHNYDTNNTNDTVIYCKKIADGQRINPFDLVQKVINTAIKLASL